MLFTRLPLLALPFLLQLCPAPAWAVYKCESNGQVTYSDATCANGKTVAIDDARGIKSPTPTASAKDKAAQQRLEKSRTAEDQRAARQRDKQSREEARARLVAEKQKRKCALLAQRKTWAEEDLRNAPVKSMEKVRRKSQRATENYRAAGCPV